MSQHYNEKQIEAANLLRSSDQNISEEVMEQIIEMIGDKSNDRLPEEKKNLESIIKIELLRESDWRRRAALSAMLISKSLE